MKKSKIILLISLLVVVFFLGFIIGLSVKDGNKSVTGKAVFGEADNVIKTESGNYTWTTAICNSKKECIDVLIKCKDGEVAGIEPISNLTIFSEDWKDYRNLDNKDFCE